MLGLNEPHTYTFYRGGRPVGHAELIKDTPQVSVDSARRDRKNFGNDIVAFAFCHPA